MRVGLLLIAFNLVVSDVAVAEPSCNLPDTDSASVSKGSGCPVFRWSVEDGTYVVHDNGEIFWVDDAGTLHFVKDASAAPEPFRSMYRALRRQPDGTMRVVDEVRPYMPLPPDAERESSYATAVAQERQSLRNEVTWWRNELYTASRTLLQAVLLPYGNAYNLIAYAYMPNREEAIAQQAAYADVARGRVLRARTMLLDELPARARAAGMPPAWLQ